MVNGKKRSKQTTIIDVAEAAGTSYSTVSRVLSNNPNVQEETRQRVLEAIKHLGYVPNQPARSLVRGQTQTIGVLVPRFDNGYIAAIVDGIDQEIRETEYSLMLFTTYRLEQKEAQYVSSITNGLAEGLIVVVPIAGEAYLEVLSKQNFPYVLVDFEVKDKDLPSISATNWEGAYEATQYLIQLGHRRIGFITGLLSIASGAERLSGYKAALHDHDIAYDPSLIQNGDFLVESGYACTLPLLALEDRPTAIFASNDLMAFGVINAIFDTGFAVPDDISVIGFDNIPQASIGRPYLTTVHQPLEEMGRMATRMLLEHLKNPDNPGHRIKLGTRLVIRDSCRAIHL